MRDPGTDPIIRSAQHYQQRRVSPQQHALLVAATALHHNHHRLLLRAHPTAAVQVALVSVAASLPHHPSPLSVPSLLVLVSYIHPSTPRGLHILRLRLPHRTALVRL